MVSPEMKRQQRRFLLLGMRRTSLEDLLGCFSSIALRMKTTPLSASNGQIAPDVLRSNGPSQKAVDDLKCAYAHLEYTPVMHGCQAAQLRRLRFLLTVSVDVFADWITASLGTASRTGRGMYSPRGEGSARPARSNGFGVKRKSIPGTWLMEMSPRYLVYGNESQVPGLWK